MKPLTLLLLLAVILIILSGGCLTDTPQKKEVTTPVTTTIPATTVTITASASPTVVSAQEPVITPIISVTTDDVMVSETEIEVPNLRVLKWNEARPEVGKLIITGIAKNEGKTVVPHAEVQIKFYDANNHLIISGKDTTENFDAGGTWGFTVVYPGPDSRKVYSYKVSITPV